MGLSAVKKPKTITDAVVEKLALRSDGFCECYTTGPGGGRCARSVRVEIHHLLSRGKTGGHEATNLAVVCNWHHRAIEHRQIDEPSWLWELKSAAGPREWSHAKGGTDSNVVLWPDVSEKLEAQAAELLHEAEVGVELAERAGPWRIAEASWQLSQGGDLWQLHDMTLATYAYHLGLKPKTVKSYILAEDRIHCIDEQFREALKSVSIMLMTQAGAEIEAMDSKQLAEMVRRIKAGDSLRSLIERAREMASVEAAEKVGSDLYLVTLSAKATTLELKVKVEQGERFWRKKALDKAMASFENRAYVKGVEWPEETTGHGVDKLEAKGESDDG